MPIPDPEALMSQVERVLLRFSGEVGEHELLKALAHEAPDAFRVADFSDPLALFRAHFLLYHLLYRLRETPAFRARHRLEIEAVRIRLWPVSSASATAIGKPDPMRDYYLDLRNLSDTTLDEIEAMLGAFWARYVALDRRGEALAVLGLASDAAPAAIRRRYRELCMRHHPDRGGDTATLQRINEAMGILDRCGGSP